MHPLRQLLLDNLCSGLKRTSVQSCSKWAENYRVVGGSFPGKWTFKYHPWLRGMHDSEAEMNVGQKSAQMGYTETALNITFYSIDVKRMDVLYVLPAKTPDASDFSAARFDPALEASPHLSNLFSDVKNIGHKRAGSANLYVRGSRSRSGLKSIPTGLILLDEVDEMTQANIPLALERAAGQLEKMVWAISTPTLPEFGINAMYLASSQEKFMFSCPKCSRITELVFPDCLVVTADEPFHSDIKNSHLVCKECNNRLEHETKHEWLKDGFWVESYKNRDARGFYINQLYSSTVKPYEIAQSYLKAQYDPSEDQEFHNSKMGVPRVVEGARVTDTDINECIGGHKTKIAANSNKIVTLGIDVGKYLHYHLDEWTEGEWIGDDINTLSTPKTLDFGKVLDIADLERIMTEYNVTYAVIDQNPERRMALSFANRFYGHVSCCVYAQGINGKVINIKEEELTVNVDRTSWLDLTLGRYKKQTIILPINLDYEYRQQIKAPIRVYRKDKDGNPVGFYENANKDDHYAHARNYSEIAFKMAVSITSNRDINIKL